MLVCLGDFLPYSRQCGWYVFVICDTDERIGVFTRHQATEQTESIVQLLKNVQNKKIMFYNEHLGFQKHVFWHNITFGSKDAFLKKKNQP